MAKKGEHRIKIGLVCQVCKNRNYISEKNKMETPEKLVLKKFCNHCRKITDHKETDKLK
jgi:large subunit ribosomal protein L33